MTRIVDRAGSGDRRLAQSLAVVSASSVRRPRSGPVKLRPTRFRRLILGSCGALFIFLGLMYIGEIAASAMGIISAFMAVFSVAVGSYVALPAVLASAWVEPERIVVRSHNTLKGTPIEATRVSHIEVTAYSDTMWMAGIIFAVIPRSLLCPTLVLHGEAKPIHIKLLSSFNITKRFGGRPARRRAEALANAIGVPFRSRIESEAPD